MMSPYGKCASREPTGSISRSKMFTFVLRLFARGIAHHSIGQGAADTKRESEQSASRALLPCSSYSLRVIPRA